MIRLWLAIAALAALGANGPATQPAAPPTTRSAFRWVDVIVDSRDQPLAAYQLEVMSRGGNMSIVGIEGGEHPAFATPPFHDRVEIVRDRVILAAYSTAADLPRGRTRVARIMVHVRGQADPQYAAKLVVAGNPDAKPIAADAVLVEGEAR